MHDLQTLRHLTRDDLAALGLGQVAYARPSIVDGQPVTSVHAANGQQLAILPSREAAWLALKQHDLELVALH